MKTKRPNSSLRRRLIDRLAERRTVRNLKINPGWWSDTMDRWAAEEHYAGVRWR